MSGNRRKGQAASSAQAAELLQATGANLSFIGFDAGILESSSFMTLLDDVEKLIDSVGVNVDPQLRIVFKKLSKRDVQTREKAVKELLQNVQTLKNDVEKLKNAFPSFATAYPALVTDASTTIRTNSNAILAAFLTVLKKETGVLLKLVMPYLLFSCSDTNNSVAKSATNSLEAICLTQEKQQKALNMFAKNTVIICLEIMLNRHKLVQPQKFTDEETDSTRQIRLFAQALNALSQVVENVSELSELVSVTFVTSSCFSKLMGMDVRVKAAAFRLLKLFLTAKPACISGSRIPSFILKELESNDVALCKNAFECFLIAANDDSFYETVKIEKAVVPKFITLVRRKHLHWNVLESSLLPSVSIIYDRLPTDQQQKWLTTILECFFDGVENGIIVVPWVKGFSEAYRFSVLKAPANLNDSFLPIFYKFFDIILSYNDGATAQIIIDLITWNQFRISNYAVLEAFNKKIIQAMLKMLPNGTKVLEAFFEHSKNYDLMTEIMFITKIPNTVFLRCFKTFYKHVSCLSNIGEIFEKRINREADHTIRRKLVKTLAHLFSINGMQGRLGNYVDPNNAFVARNVMEIADAKIVLGFDNAFLDNVTMKVLSQLFIDPTFITTQQLTAFFKVSSDQVAAAAAIQSFLEENASSFTLETLMILFEAIFSVGNENFAIVLGKKLYEMLLSLYFVHFCENGEVMESDDTELDEFLKSLKEAANYCFCAVFKPHWISSIYRRIDIWDQTVSAETIKRLAALLGALHISKEMCLELFPSTADVAKLFGQINRKFAFDVVATSSSSRFVPALITLRALVPMTRLDLPHLLRRALFYGRFSETLLGDKEYGELEGGALGRPFIFALLVEAAVELRANRSMFSQKSDRNYLLTFKELFNFIDRHFDAPVYDYRTFLATPPASAYLFGLALNDFQIAKQRPHVSCVLTPSVSTLPTNDDSVSKLLTLLEGADAGGTQKIINFLEEYVVDDRSKYEEWLFTIGSDQVKSAVAAVFLRCLVTLMRQNVPLPSEIHDFLHCGFMYTLQGITDVFAELKPGATCDDFTLLTAYFCLDIAECHDTLIGQSNPNVNEKEWRDFYRPSVVNHFNVWIALLDPVKNIVLPSLFINKLVGVTMNFSYEQFKNGKLIDALKDSTTEPLGLTWTEYDSDIATLVKLALRFVYNENEANAATCFLGIYILKCCSLNMYACHNRPTTPRTSDNKSLENQIINSSADEHKRMPAMLRIILSPGNNKHLAKFFVWDSLIQFLAGLDVMTRATYAGSLDASIINHMFPLMFKSVPKDIIRNYKLFTFKGNLSAQNIFTTPVSFLSAANAATMEHYIANLFYRTIICLPSYVREWYLGLSRSESQEMAVFNRLLSPAIIEREINSVGVCKNERLSVKGVLAIREIIASYCFEEATITLKITLPEDYPFTRPTIDYDHMLVSEKILRKWIRNLMMFLDKQNGLMLEGILQWKRAIDSHLDGIEDCSICMSTVSTTNYTLPQLQCRECKKKFHGHCLYKWFETTNVPTCPMCRNTFYN